MTVLLGWDRIRMMMNTVPSLAQLILIGSNDTVAARVRDYLRAGGSHWSTEDLRVAADFDEVQTLVKQGGKTPSLVILAPKAASAELEAWLSTAGKMDLVVNIVISDNHGI